MSRYPMPALWIDTRFPDRIRITPVIVEKIWRDESKGHLAQINTHQNKFPLTLTRPLSELATTAEKALAKLPSLLTALESRPPLTNSGKGPENAPRGMTDASAENLQPALA